jgi:hypothetical protein
VGLSPGGPSARWGASGGIDLRTPSISDPILPGPNNTFFLAGGFDGENPEPLSDVWRLSLSGTLSSNMPDSVNGSWSKVSIGNLPGRVEQAGTVVLQQIVAMGGCASSTSLTATNSTCATQDSFIINTQSQTTVTPSICPAPRASPVLVPNLNGFSTAFASQVFLMLGTFNTSLWQDSNGLSQGEVVRTLEFNYAYVLFNNSPCVHRQFWISVPAHGLELYLLEILVLRLNFPLHDRAPLRSPSRKLW